jgi:four helix bundle protein
MSNYQTVIAWQKAMDFADTVYEVVARFDGPGTYALANQMRRAAISIPSNIAEGNGRGRYRESINFVRYARGSTMELETQAIFAARRKLISPDREADLLKQTAEVARVINGLLRYLNKKARGQKAAKM